MIRPLVHLLCGPTGAGKTTYALALAQQTGAVHFSIDEWMVNLFWPDAPAPLDYDWALQRIARCERQAWSTVLQLAKLGTPSVLDFGLLRFDHRQQWAARTAEAGLSVALHVADANAAERWRRVQARNTAKGETFRLTVTREMFDFVETLWEPPKPEELHALNGRYAAPAI